MQCLQLFYSESFNGLGEALFSRVIAVLAFSCDIVPEVAVIGFSLLLMHLNLRDIGEHINIL